MDRVRYIKTILLLLLAGAAMSNHVIAQTIKGNVYGGGEMAKVEGNTNVTINAGTLGADIFGGGEGKLSNEGTVSMSADVSGDTHVTINGGEFAVEYDNESSADIKPFKEHYNIYGGGNIASAAGNTHLYITKGMFSNASDGSTNFLSNANVQGIAQAYYHEGQMYFCIFGGGFGKNTSVTGNTWVDFNISGMTDINSTAIEDDLLEYQSYLDVIGGGFNGTVLGNTNVHVGGNAMCRNVYGGGLYATIGTPDDADKGKTNVYITGGNIDNVYGGGVMGDIFTSTNVNIGLHEKLSYDGRDYAVTNDKVTVLMSVYGGNDVSGKVSQANIVHNGGQVDQNIFGAGNGDYIGYYTPGLCDYAEGENDNYYYVDHSGDTSTDGKNTVGPKGNTYKGRPQTGNVSITIAGNSSEDKASVLGQVFGGGNSCTVGMWETNLSSKYEGDPHKWRDDPDFFKGGGTLNITLGSHVKIGRTHAELATASDEDKEAYLAKGENVSGLYMGCSGRHLATQVTSAESNSYHHYYDHYTAKYWPGFAVFADNGAPLSRAEGLTSFNAYLNNILIWSDNVSLNIADDVEDVWLSNFVGGGFRGSMKAKTAIGQFHYSLPRGVTIGHDIVGGAYNTDVVYRVYDTESDMHTYKIAGDQYIYRTDIKEGWDEGEDYHHVEYADDGTTITGIVRFYYDGGILSHDNSGNRRHGVFVAYGSGDDNVIDFSGYTSEQGLRKHKDKALVYVDARCQLEPEIVDDHVRGGNVFGGCFESGTVDGDIWTDYRCYIANKWYGNENFNGGPTMFANAADYQQNFAMMAFGAGYGKNTSIKGDAYLRIIYNKENTTATYPCLYNVFGGSFQGTVDGNTNIYYNAGQQGLTVGGIYGGGSQGYVAGKSFVELAGGYISNVYGGAREANVGKGTHVWAYDGKLRNWADDLAEHDDAPLVVERMFGGSDVSGLIGFSADATDVNDDSKRVEDAGWTAYFSTANWPEELFVNGTNASGGLKKFDSYIQIGGTDHSDRGYPLVGQIYAGGNGENTDTEHGHVLPGINTALIELSDGNVIEAFGGGNAATVHKQNYILTNGQNAPVSKITMPNAHLTQILQERVLRNTPDCYTLSGNTFTFKPYNVQRLFGGNNVATMAIQPKWNLKNGYIGNVYSGGNEGDMTYYNATPKTGESKGLCITVNSDNIHIESLYGGCRMSDVKAMLYSTDSEGNTTETPQTFGPDDYGATVNIIAGHIENVYGGNDVSGYVYNGTNVNIKGSVTGNVYGAGNGNYLYAYDKENKYTSEKNVAAVWNTDINKTVYWVKGDNASPSALQLLTTLNNVRPHVAKAYLNIAGDHDGVGEKVYIHGSVYCGGNASTIRPKDGGGNDAHVKFNIGNNVIVNHVFMGSNGESMKYDAYDKDNTYLVDFEKVNGLEFSADISDDDWISLVGDDELKDMSSTLRSSIYPNLLSVYMRAVDMKAMPQGFTEDFSTKTFTNTWIGTFCMGGNAGSMMVDQPVDITFPQSLNFFGRIIGGSQDASFQYKGQWHRGGFRMPLVAGALLDGQPTKTKLRMKIRGNWYSRRIVVDDEDTYKSSDYLALDKTDDGKTWKVDGKAWLDGCNVYGGCYQSGDMVGDVQIYIESDMLAYSDPRYGTTIDTYTNTELDESNKLNLPVANVYGAGYGPESRNYGDAYIYMKDIPDVAGSIHPSVNNIFGGGRNGMLVGNSIIHVHDGLVYQNVVGGCFAAPMYGSAQVTIGYPKFYVCKKSGEYFLDRADKWNVGYKTKGNNREDDVIKKSIKYFEGTYVPCNVYDLITGVRLAGSAIITDLSSIHPENRVGNDYFEFHNEYDDTKENLENYFPTGGWENVEIRVRGGVYGGGFSLSNSTAAVAGSYTTLASTEEYNHGTDSQGNSSVGYGGNSSVIITDQGNVNHIKISTENPVVDGKYSGTGGIYGDGRLVFCEGFRAAELNGYGYAGDVDNPLMLNSLQRIDLLTINDCCFKLYGDQDFATDQLDARKYSLSRIGELRMNSSIDAGSDIGTTKRNYISFFNNIHYLGAIVTNDDFLNGKFHDYLGNVASESYYEKKQGYITDWDASDKSTAAENLFKQRNYATARNMVGINSGFCLRVENQYYDGAEKKSYYGPIVGVAEVKLLNVQPGEGGGYVYADNIHADIYDPDHAGTATFMNESGNFVFPSMVRTGETEKQYIVDDCLPQGFEEWKKGRAAHSELPEQHYWYVIGDTYYYNTTLTAYSYSGKKEFDLIHSDPNVIFAGIEENADVTLESVKWLPVTYPTEYTGDLRGGRDDKLTPLSGEDKYKFMLQIGDANIWNQEMPRSTGTEECITVGDKPHSSYEAPEGGSLPTMPQFNVHLLDNVNNCPKDEEENYYNNHLSVPEHVQLIIKSKKDGQPDKTYNVTLEIVYLQGPSFTGSVKLNNCALPGEKIGFSSDGIEIKTTELLPLTGFAWKLVPLTREDRVEDKMVYEWDAISEQAVEIPNASYNTALDGSVEGSIQALYSQNHWNVFYTFTAAGETFTVEPTKDEAKPLQERMIVVHNYHKMADVLNSSYGIEASVVSGARVYIKDVDDLNAFMAWVNAGKTTEGVNFILQDNLELPAEWNLSNNFAGSFHGDGYHISSSSTGKSFFGSYLTGSVYNLGMIGGTIASQTSSDQVINCYEYVENDDFKYGKKAYLLSHYFKPTTDGYVEQYYANGDYQYATTDLTWSLRTGAPNYGYTATHHNTEHTHDVLRWKDTDDDGVADTNVPLYDGSSDAYSNDYLFFGQHLDQTDADAYPIHIGKTADNRVYETAGYYHSKDDKKFYYNKDAWALQHALTAINYIDRTAEGDGASSLPTKFSVDSEVSKNLLVYNNGATVFDKKDEIDIAEKNLIYHNLVNNEGVFETEYFHLVDKQCFNAPIAFKVTKRAWYERLPKYFRNVSGDGENYANPSAWEGICLPFTATKVTASENGEISHFYGNNAVETIDGINYDVSELHHEYWLNGMTDYADGIATFMRPAASGEGLFVDNSKQASLSYTYQNTYFSGLANYGNYYDSRNPEMEWYNTSHTYADYTPLSAGVPYIVSFPGNDFYEFSLQGTEYDPNTHKKTKTDVAQKITFESGATTIQVSDDELSGHATEIGDNKHVGSYMHTSAVYGMNDNGSMFESGKEALPFRTFFATATTSPQTRSILIMDPYLKDLMEEEPESPEDELGEEYLRIWAEGHDIIIETSEARNFNLYRYDGTFQGILQCVPGRNSFTQESVGIYLVGQKKLLLR